MGAKFTGFCPQNDKSTRFNIFYYFTLQYFNLSAASHAYSAGHGQIWYANKYFIEIPLTYFCYCGSLQQHSLTLRTFLYRVILKKFSIQYPRFNMDFYGDRPYLSDKMADSSGGTQYPRSDWSDCMSIKLFANGQMGCVFCLMLQVVTNTLARHKTRDIA